MSGTNAEASGNWPDPKRPGYPTDADRDGCHWVAGTVMHWSASGLAWRNLAGFVFSVNELRREKYEGPVRTDAEVRAAAVAGWVKGRSGLEWPIAPTAASGEEEG